MSERTELKSGKERIDPLLYVFGFGWLFYCVGFVLGHWWSCFMVGFWFAGQNDDEIVRLKELRRHSR